jgi:Arc/MetJ family transcription regulator
MAQEISETAKTSLTIDRRKAAEVRAILGTKTLVETVDAAFDEVIRLAARRRIMERIRRDGGLGPPPEELHRLRNPRGGGVSR